MLPDEQRLIASCQAGSYQDFDPLYRQYVTPIYRFLYRRCLDKAIAEDLTSMVFMKALEKIGTYAPSKGTFSSWLYQIARNSMTDHFRSNRKTTDIEDVWDLQSGDNVEMDVNDRVMYEKLKPALALLKPDQREVLLLRIWEGLSYKEIAQLTGKTEANCKVIFSRTIASLRKDMPIALFLLLLVFPFFR